MNERPPADDDDDAVAERLAGLEADLEAGRSPSHPRGGSQPRGLAALKALRRLKPPRSTIAWNNAPTIGSFSGQPAQTRVGRFQILRELGRGGFGVVFLAFDPRLDREIALKVPHPGALIDPHLRDRFLREARAAAGLKHPNIVAVHEVDQSGPVPALVSEYCPGQTLAAWQARLKSAVPAEEAARIVAELADGVAHAHDRGVLHRDLKPANILVSDGDRPTPHITDFGLAKVQDDTSPATKSGAILGTPAYMAPEQARGRPADARTDVYGLGAILYELLVGRPPFIGDTDVETLQMVHATEPIAPRQLRPKLPRDLETVCLKCLEKDPARRYESAVALRDDLRRFLAREPVVARPVGRIARAARWCRRRPLVASLAAALLSAVTLGLTGIILQVREAHRQRDDAIAARDRTDRVLAQSRDVLQQMIDLGQSQVHDASMVPATIRILTLAREHYHRLSAEDPDNAELRRQAATICRRLAVIYENHGTAEQADEAFTAARDLTERLVADHPNDADLRVDLYTICQLWAKSLQNRSELDRADPILDRAIEVVSQDLATSDARRTTVIALALSLYTRAEQRRRRGDSAGAEADYRQAIALHAPREIEGDRIEFTTFLTAYYTRLATILVRSRRFSEAEPIIAIARKRLEQFKDRYDETHNREFSTTCDSLLGQIRLESKDWAEAERLLRAANEAVLPHVATAPPRLGYHGFASRNSLLRARALDELGRPDEARAVLLAATEAPLLPADKQNKHPGPDIVECYAELLPRLRDRPEERAAVAGRARQLLDTVRGWPTHAAANAKLEKALADVP